MGRPLRPVKRTALRGGTGGSPHARPRRGRASKDPGRSARPNPPGDLSARDAAQVRARPSRPARPSDRHPKGGSARSWTRMGQRAGGGSGRDAPRPIEPARPGPRRSGRRPRPAAGASEARCHAHRAGQGPVRTGCAVLSLVGGAGRFGRDSFYGLFRRRVLTVSIPSSQAATPDRRHSINLRMRRWSSARSREKIGS